MKYRNLILAVALMTMAAPAVAQTTIFTGAVQDGATVLPNQVNPAAFGTVDPTGFADSTAAFQAAINTGMQVAVPPGLYNVCGLQPYVYNTVGVMQLVGTANNRQRQAVSTSGIFAAALMCASGDMFTMAGGTNQTYIGISGLELISATGGGHIFNFGSSTYVVDYELTDILFNQNNPAKSWIVGSGGMQEMTMDRVFGLVAGANSVPAVQLDGEINVIDIGYLNISAAGLYGIGALSQHYLFELNQNSGTASNVHIHDSLCEQATAGCFNLNNIGNASIDDVINYDQPTTPTAPFITIGSASSQVELKSVFSNYGTASIPDLVCPAGVCEFHNTALTYANLGGVILDQRALLVAHYLDYTPAQQTDAELMGVWSTQDGSSGGGMTGNLLAGSDNFTGWSAVNSGTGSAPDIKAGITDPLGGTNAIQVTFAIGSGTTINDYSELRQTISPGAGTYTLSVWVKSCNAGSVPATFALSISNLEFQNITTTTTSWHRFSSSALNSNGTSVAIIGLMGWLAPPTVGTQCLDIYGAQFTPGIAIHPYVSTTYAGAAIPIQPMLVFNGKPVLTTVPATVVQTNQTNLYGTYLQDFSAATWKSPSGFLSGDCTWTSLGVITCTKSNGTAFGAGAFAAVATAASVGLGNVTNNVQTQAAIVPNTMPSAGQDLVGNAGGTAYAPVTMSGDCTRSSTGAITCAKVNGVSYGASPATGTVPVVTGTNTVNYTSQVGISGGSPVKATNTYSCLDGYDHLPCVVWKAATLTGQTGNAFPPNFVPSKAGLYRVTTTACMTTVGTAGTVQPLNQMGTSLSYNYQPAAYALHFTSALGSCSVQRTDERAAVSGSSYQIKPSTLVVGNVGGQYSLDAYAEYMGP